MAAEQRLVASRSRHGGSSASGIAPSAGTSRTPCASRESSVASRDREDSRGSRTRAPVAAPVATPAAPPETGLAALTSTLESLLKGLGSVAGGSRSIARNPTCREAGREGESASGCRETGREGEAAGWVREASCGTRVPAEVRKSGGEVEEEGKSRDDER